MNKRVFPSVGVRTLAGVCGALALAAATSANATYVNSGVDFVSNPNGVYGLRNMLPAGYGIGSLTDIGLDLGTQTVANAQGVQYHGVMGNFNAGDSISFTGDQFTQVDPMDTAGGPKAFWGVGQEGWCQTGQCTSIGSFTSKGWNHTSQHFLIRVAETQDLTITLSNGAEDLLKWGPNGGQEGILGDDLKPAFTLYQGANTTGNNPGNHTFANGYSYSGANTPLNNYPNLPLVASGVVANNAGALTATQTFLNLAPGDYTLYIGGIMSKSATFPQGNVQNADGSHGKNFTLTVASAPVPVPAAVWLFGSALAGMGVIGRRKERQA